MTDTRHQDTAAADWAPALEALAHRILGDPDHQVSFVALDAPGRHFAYDAADGRLRVRATGPGSAAVGLGHYLRHHCGVAVSWDAPRPPVPVELPEAPHTEGTARVEEAYYLNFCTFGYTTPWWGWEEWEQEIDWMALRGVTTPLMAVGHEAVLERTLLDTGLGQAEVDSFLCGPAYLPWLAMSNLDSFAGPLPTGWTTARRDLAGRILQRQRELGMRPVLPAFTGHVPEQLAGSGGARDWQGHRTYMIGPEDPLFRKLTADVARVQEEFWGTDHRYASDPFIEMTPVDDDPGYPGRVATTLLDGLTDADPEAVWYLQTWPFSYQREFWTEERVRIFLGDIPAERLVLLDLWAEAEPQWRRFDSFGGRKWMWCALLNFGGRTDPIANLPGAEREVAEALGSAHPPMGLGLSMEATRTSPVFFERVLDLAWHDPAPLTEWLTKWAAQRYQLPAGPLQRLAASAWHALASTIFDSGSYRIFPEDFTGLITQRPAIDVLADPERLRHEVLDLLWYDPAVLVSAWQALIELAEADPDRAGGPLGRDLIEVALAIVPRYAELCFLAAYAPGDEPTDPEAGGRFFEVLDDLDRLLATRPEYRYDTWERAAVAWAQDDEGARILADNARRLVTVWGRSGDGYLDDYSARLWAGLVPYYRDRWRHWAELREAPAEQLERALRTREEAFLQEGAKDVPAGDVVAESRRLLRRYAEAFCRAAEAIRAGHLNGEH